MNKKIIISFVLCVGILTSLLFILIRQQNNQIWRLCTIANEKGNYRVNIKDKRGKLIYDEEYKIEPEIKLLDKNTFLIKRGAGDWYTYIFVNVENGLVSDIFNDISVWNHEKVVYAIFDDNINKIIVQDIYDKDKYYMEIVRDYTPTAVPRFIILKAEFLSSSQLKLEYYCGENFEVKQEIINL